MLPYTDIKLASSYWSRIYNDKHTLLTDPGQFFTVRLIDKKTAAAICKKFQVVYTCPPLNETPLPRLAGVNIVITVLRNKNPIY